MPLAVLEKEISTLPAESMLEIIGFINYLKFKYASSEKTSTVSESKLHDVSKRFGAFPELHAVPIDIDFCNDEIAEMFGV